MTVYVPVTAEHEASLCFARTVLKQLAEASNDDNYARHATVLHDLIETTRMLAPTPDPALEQVRAWAREQEIRWLGDVA